MAAPARPNRIKPRTALYLYGALFLLLLLVLVLTSRKPASATERRANEIHQEAEAARDRQDARDHRHSAADQ